MDELSNENLPSTVSPTRTCNMVELSNENSPSTVSPTRTSTESTVEEINPSREDASRASREDGKRKLHIGNLPENSKRMKSVQYVTRPSFEKNESNIGESFDDNNTSSITDNNEVVHKNTSANNDDSGSESSSNSPGFTRREGSRPSELFINDGSRECYNMNWSYINLAQLQSTEDVCVVNKVILFQVLYYVLAKQDSKVEYMTRSGKTSHATFERMLFAMDLNARKGMNVGVFLLGKKQNAEIYTSCLDQRDTSTFGKNYIHVSWLLSLQ